MQSSRRQARLLYHTTIHNSSSLLYKTTTKINNVICVYCDCHWNDPTVSHIYWWPQRATRLHFTAWWTQLTRLSAQRCTESLCTCSPSGPSDRPSGSLKLRRSSSWQASHTSEPRSITWCHNSTSSKRPRWKTSSLHHRSRSPTLDLRQSWCAGCPLHANSAWDSSSHMRKWATRSHHSFSGTSRA